MHIIWCNWYQFNYSGESPLDLNCAYNRTFVGWIIMFFIIVSNLFNICGYRGRQDITRPLSLSGRCGTAPKPLRGLWRSTLNLSEGCDAAQWVKKDPIVLPFSEKHEYKIKKGAHFFHFWEMSVKKKKPIQHVRIRPYIKKLLK